MFINKMSHSIAYKQWIEQENNLKMAVIDKPMNKIKRKSRTLSNIDLEKIKVNKYIINPSKDVNITGPKSVNHLLPTVNLKMHNTVPSTSANSDLNDRMDELILV